MILLDKGGCIRIFDRGVPPFPEALEGRVLAAQMIGAEKDAERSFFKEYARLCAFHNIPYPENGTSEDWVHLRRLLARHPLAGLKRWAVEFLKDYGETLAGGYHHHLRLFSAWIKESR